MRKRILIGLTAGLSILFGFSAFAADMKYVRIESSTDVEEGKVDADAISFKPMKGSDFKIESEDFTNKEGYKLGNPVIISFTLKADDGSKFIDIKPAACLIDGTAASEAKIMEQGNKLVLNYELPAIHQRLNKVTDLKLDADGTASWKKAEYADSYEVTVEVLTSTGGRSMYRKFKTDKTSIDLSDSIFEKEGDYVYSVVATADAYYLDDSEKALLPVGSSRLVSKEDIGEPISCLDKDKGRARIANEYVAGKEVNIGGAYYYFDENNTWISGWKEFSEGWKYYDPESHKRVKGTNTINGAVYYLDKETGIMQTGFVETEDGEKFFSEDGKLTTGWVNFEGDVYYIDKDGRKSSKNLIDDNNKTYIFYKDGRLVR
ncbi:MAG: hypothetical protein Q4P22_05675 [Eubacteriales bacterium]|nr:hypothetical protein [Eubacteriales bacterium]